MSKKVNKEKILKRGKKRLCIDQKWECHQVNQ